MIGRQNGGRQNEVNECIQDMGGAVTQWAWLIPLKGGGGGAGRGWLLTKNGKVVADLSLMTSTVCAGR